MVEAEEGDVEGVEGGEPADEEEEDERGGEEEPVELLLGGLHEVLVGEGPRDAEEEDDDEEDEDHGVWERGEREGVEDGGVSPSIRH